MRTSVYIATGRLVLRTVTMQDAPAVASSWNLDAEPISQEEARGKIAWMQRNHAQNAPLKLVHLCLAIIVKDTQGFIGWCGLDHTDQSRPNPVLFYLLKEKWWGKGLATEAAGALVDYAFRAFDLERIDGGAARENLASKRVMEKFGMTYLGLNAEGGHAFTLTREAYRKRHI